MARKKEKFGKYITLYLSNEAIAKLIKSSAGNKSRYVDALIIRNFVNQEEVIKEVALKEVDEVINGTVI